MNHVHFGLVLSQHWPSRNDGLSVGQWYPGLVQGWVDSQPVGIGNVLFRPELLLSLVLIGQILILYIFLKLKLYRSVLVYRRRKHKQSIPRP